MIQTTPAIEGVTPTQEQELRQVLTKAENSGEPHTSFTPGAMWSDTVGVPEGFSKQFADQTERAVLG